MKRFVPVVVICGVTVALGLTDAGRCVGWLDVTGSGMGGEAVAESGFEGDGTGGAGGCVC